MNSSELIRTGVHRSVAIKERVYIQIKHETDTIEPQIRDPIRSVLISHEDSRLNGFADVSAFRLSDLGGQVFG